MVDSMDALPGEPRPEDTPPEEAPPRVVLLRSPDDSSDNAEGEDRYERALRLRGFQATCRPVLRFAFAGDEGFGGGDVQARLRRPERYAGLVVTSPRAARALGDAFRVLPGQQPAWARRPVFAVGPKTAAALRQSGLEPRGEESGHAEALADVVVKALKGAKGEATRPLLFLCGNRRREALPERLRAEGVPFEECVAYETHLRAGPWLEGAEPAGWAVFFSPSGVEAVRQSQEAGWAAVRKAALGPATARALRDAGWPPDAVAQAPSPEALAEALFQAARDQALPE